MYLDNPGATPELAKQKEAELINVEERWNEFYESLKRDIDSDTAKEIVSAFRDHYSVYTDGIVTWFANLYDVGTGAFYYSNSGRDTACFRPDLESTYQTLQFMRGSGMCSGLIESECVPKWMSDKIVYFTKNLQHPNGYFYHPQWGKEMIDIKVSRRGRDLCWADRILKRFNSEPTYDTPSGTKGNGILADGSRASDYRPMENNLECEQPVATVAIPEHLSSKEAFLKYLEGLDVHGDGYYVGNLFESQCDQIRMRDEVIAKEGADYRFADILTEFFTSHQNPRTGLFTPYDEVDYLGINGLLKILSTYHRLGKEFPRSAEAFGSAMKILTSSVKPTTVCFVLNPWYAMTNLIANIEMCHPEGSECHDAVKRMRREMLLNAPALIRATTDKVKLFLKSDGSFSYMPHMTGANSQGLPVAIYGTNEGDVNSTYIISVAVTDHLFNIFGYKMIPMFTRADRTRMLNIIEEKISSYKSN